MVSRNVEKVNAKNKKNKKEFTRFKPINDNKEISLLEIISLNYKLKKELSNGFDINKSSDILLEITKNLIKLRKEFEDEKIKETITKVIKKNGVTAKILKRIGVKKDAKTNKDLVDELIKLNDEIVEEIRKERKKESTFGLEVPNLEKIFYEPTLKELKERKAFNKKLIETIEEKVKKGESIEKEIKLIEKEIEIIEKNMGDVIKINSFSVLYNEKIKLDELIEEIKKIYGHLEINRKIKKINKEFEEKTKKFAKKLLLIRIGYLDKKNAIKEKNEWIKFIEKYEISNEDAVNKLKEVYDKMDKLHLIKGKFEEKWHKYWKLRLGISIGLIFGGIIGGIAGAPIGIALSGFGLLFNGISKVFAINSIGTIIKKSKIKKEWGGEIKNADMLFEHGKIGSIKNIDEFGNALLIRGERLNLFDIKKWIFGILGSTVLLEIEKLIYINKPISNIDVSSIGHKIQEAGVIEGNKESVVNEILKSGKIGYNINSPSQPINIQEEKIQYIAQYGDSIWSLSEKMLKDHFQGFNNLNYNEKIKLINFVKNWVKENAKDLGIHLDKNNWIEVNEKIIFNLESIKENAWKQEHIKRIFEKMLK